MRMNQLIRGALLSASLLLSACERASPVDPFGTGDAPARPREETSILGVWSLQTVHIEGQLRDGSPPLSNMVNVKPGANGTMYTKDIRRSNSTMGTQATKGLTGHSQTV